MAKRPTIVNLTTSNGSQAAINTSLSNIAAKFDEILSRKGDAPNNMEADLDMDSNDIVNAGTVNTANLKVGGVNFVPGDVTTISQFRGDWATATAYNVNEFFVNNGNGYIVVLDHTSGVFNTDLADGKIALFAEKGANGAGTGDLLAANNLNDVADADTSLTNLGGGAKGIAIFKDGTSAAVLTELGIPAYIQTLLDDADAATARTTLGLSNAATRDYGWEIIDTQDLATDTSAFTSFDPATYSRYRITYENIGSDGASAYALFKWGAENNAGANNLWTGKFTDWAGIPASYPAAVEVEQQLNSADLFDYLVLGREGGSLSLTFEINDMPYSTISAPTIQLEGFDRKGWITADTVGQMSSFGISNFTLFGTGVGTAPTTATGLIGKRFVEAWRK